MMVVRVSVPSTSKKAAVAKKYSPRLMLGQAVNGGADILVCRKSGQTRMSAPPEPGKLECLPHPNWGTDCQAPLWDSPRACLDCAVVPQRGEHLPLSGDTVCGARRLHGGPGILPSRAAEQ